MQVSLIICRLEMELAILGGQTVAKAMACVEESKTGMVPIYQRLRATVANRPPALTMLKDVYATWLATMTGIGPGAGDSMRSWKLRLGSLEQKLQEQATRLEIELQ
jgi:hypothetical protein